MKNVDIIDSWRLVKFITDLHNHPHTIKGDFGHVKELENLISKDIETRRMRFDNLVQIANCIFTNNLCSNKIQLLVENELIDKIADFNRIDFDVGKLVKLIKSLNGYYIKNEELCDKIKNVLETYLNAYMKMRQENFYENEKYKKKKNQKIEEIENENYNEKDENDNSFAYNNSKEANEEDFKFNKNVNEIKGRKIKVSKQLYKKESIQDLIESGNKENNLSNEENQKNLIDQNTEENIKHLFSSNNVYDNDDQNQQINENKIQSSKVSTNKANFSNVKSKTYNKKTQKEESDSEPDLVLEPLDASDLDKMNSQSEKKKIKTINYEFMERYNKIITNISVIFWSLSKNEKFKSLKNTREDYKYFFERMKETTLNNLEFYNEREITFILKAFKDLNISLSKSENKNFAKKISSLDNYTLHDRVCLLSIFLKNEMGGSLELILKFIEKIKQSFNSLTYSDLIEFLELLNSVPNLSNKILKENKNEKIAFIEKRLAPIMQSIEIEKFCKLFLLAGKFQGLFTQNFLDILTKNLISRLNEIPKEYFCAILQKTVNFSVFNASTRLFDILEDLSHFENIKENFVKFEDLNNLLWACFSFSKVKVNELLDNEKEGESNVNNELALKLINFSKSLVANLIGIENFIKFEETGKTKINFTNDNNYNLNEELKNEKINGNELIQNKPQKMFEEVLDDALKNLNSKINIFIKESFNVNNFITEFDTNTTKNFLADKTSIVIYYFQTMQLLLQFIKNNLYFNLDTEKFLYNNNETISEFNKSNLNSKTQNEKADKLKFNAAIKKILTENFNDLKENLLASLSDNSVKSDVSILDNFVLTDAASQNSKDFTENVLKNVDLFFAKKPNCSIYQNLIDDYFNAINISVVFEIPKLEETQYVTGIDANKYAVIFLNENYFSAYKKNENNKNTLLKFYENRINLLSEIFDWKIILIKDNAWNNQIDNKQNYLKEKFGFDMQDEENIRIIILDRNHEADNDDKDNQIKRTEQDSSNNNQKKPKYNLTKQIINKKQNKK